MADHFAKMCSAAHSPSTMTLFLSCNQVAQQLTNEVLTPRSQQAKVLGVNKVNSADQVVSSAVVFVSLISNYSPVSV